MKKETERFTQELKSAAESLAESHPEIASLICRAAHRIAKAESVVELVKSHPYLPNSLAQAIEEKESRMIFVDRIAWARAMNEPISGAK